MSNSSVAKAVIYTRVSSAKQTTRGDGLGSQETRCREYARYKGYAVAEVFKDDASGGLINRPGMLAMLAFLKTHRRESVIVIIDDISRLARGLEAHLQLRAAIGAAGGRLESPSIEFGEDSDSLLVENLLASVSQHQRQKNAEQTRNRMRARASNGYWVFGAPVGYRFERVSGHGKLLVPDALSAIVREALEGYAAGRFVTQAEVKRFLETHPSYPKDRNGAVRNQRVTDLLTNILYAGLIDLPDWGLRLVAGKHEALISYETFQAVQKRLNGGAYVPARKDLSEDFPLRGFIACGDCGRPLTACWSKGKLGGRYPYYLCPARDCGSYGKSIRRDRIEGEFTSFLQTIKPSAKLFGFVAAMLRDMWDAETAAERSRAVELQAELGEAERRVEQLLDRIVETDSAAVVSAYEKRIQRLEERKIILADRPVRSAAR